MENHTEYLNMKTPLKSEKFNLNVFNGNIQIIDSKFKETDEKIAEMQEKIETPTGIKTTDPESWIRPITISTYKKYTYYLAVKFMDSPDIQIFLSDTPMHCIRNFSDDINQSTFGLPCYHKPVSTYCTGDRYTINNDNVTVKKTNEYINAIWRWEKNTWHYFRNIIEFMYANYQMVYYDSNTAGIITQVGQETLRDIGLIQRIIPD